MTHIILKEIEERFLEVLSKFCQVPPDQSYLSFLIFSECKPKMALTFQALFVALTLVAYGDAAGIGNVFKLSRIGKTFRRLPMSTRGLERSADMAGYTFGIVGAY